MKNGNGYISFFLLQVYISSTTASINIFKDITPSYSCDRPRRLPVPVYYQWLSLPNWSPSLLPTRNLLLMFNTSSCSVTDKWSLTPDQSSGLLPARELQWMLIYLQHPVIGQWPLKPNWSASPLSVTFTLVAEFSCRCYSLPRL